jgi:TatD DNase family protein
MVSCHFYVQISISCICCVNILFGRQIGPFPAGVLLHSYLGSAEMVSGFANLGCYFSLSGFLTGMKSTKAKKMLKSVSRFYSLPVAFHLQKRKVDK